MTTTRTFTHADFPRLRTTVEILEPVLKADLLEPAGASAAATVVEGVVLLQG